eukprot:scpid100782/ scgid25456/ 
MLRVAVTLCCCLHVFLSGGVLFGRCDGASIPAPRAASAGGNSTSYSATVSPLVTHISADDREFSLVCTHNHPLAHSATYIWMKEIGDEHLPVHGCTGNVRNCTLTVREVQYVDVGQYVCSVSVAGLTMISQKATVAITESLPDVPEVYRKVDTFTSSVSPAVTRVGSDATSFSLTCASNFPVPWATYEWKRQDGDPLSLDRCSGLTHRTLVIRDVQSTDAGMYLCSKMAFDMSITSQPASVVVNLTVPTATIRLGQISSFTVFVSPVVLVIGPEVRQFSLVCTHNHPHNLSARYVWFREDGRGLSPTRAHGTNGRTLTVRDVQESDMGQYLCLVSVNQLRVTSKPATILIGSSPDSEESMPASIQLTADTASHDTGHDSSHPSMQLVSGPHDGHDGDDEEDDG